MQAGLISLLFFRLSRNVELGQQLLWVRRGSFITYGLGVDDVGFSLDAVEGLQCGQQAPPSARLTTS